MRYPVYLIQMNTYNSIKAPQNRGFSYVEIWFVGIQAPIFLAILEYGILLGIKKFWPHKESFFKNVDLSMLILSTIYLLVFNGFYWLAWNQIWPKSLEIHYSILSNSFYWKWLNKNQILNLSAKVFCYWPKLKRLETACTTLRKSRNMNTVRWYACKIYR